MFDNLSQLAVFNLSVSWGLCILIWLVQVIIYPGFRRISSHAFESYHRWYTIRISAVVIPLMLCEVVVTIAWLGFDNYSFFSLMSVFLVAIIWLSTFLLQVPMHKCLQSGKDDACIRRLVTTNWIRTIAWSLKAIAVTIGAGKSVS